MLEEKWVSFPLENVNMEKLNLNFFYELGSHLVPLTTITSAPDDFFEWEVISHCKGAIDSIERLVIAFPDLLGSESTAQDFLAHLERYIKFHKEDRASGSRITAGNTATISLEWEANAFESILLESLQGLPAFHVTGKRIYDTVKLIDHFERNFSDTVLSKMNKKIVDEINQSGRCLAFDCYTACGFHILRATEAVLHQYYIAVCKPSSQKPLGSWNEYIKKLYPIKEDDVKMVVALLQPIKRLDRNYIMHPELVLTEDEAIEVFDTAKVAIEMMIKRIPTKKIKKRH